MGCGRCGEGRCRERRDADHMFVQIYFRMHRFVVKFSHYFFRLRRQGGIDPPNQNPADAVGCTNRARTANGRSLGDDARLGDGGFMAS